MMTMTAVPMMKTTATAMETGTGTGTGTGATAMETGTMMTRAAALEWIDIGRLADIPPRGARCVQTPHGRIGVFRTADDRVFALDNRCPHRGGPLTEGIVHGHSVTCPLHNWVISLETGRALGADEGAVRTIPLRNEDGALFIALERLMAAAE